MEPIAPGALVMIVEDEPDLSRLEEFNLREAGFDVAIAGSAREFFERFAERRPRVVVLDLMLPDLSGVEVYRRLRADHDNDGIAVLIASARGEEYDRVVCFEMGADDFIAKPFSVRELVLRVRSLASRFDPRVARSKSRSGR
jgi:two-component system phosphate regulon response regulator PhoB